MACAETCTHNEKQAGELLSEANLLSRASRETVADRSMRQLNYPTTRERRNVPNVFAMVVLREFSASQAKQVAINYDAGQLPPHWHRCGYGFMFKEAELAGLNAWAGQPCGGFANFS